MGVFKKGAMRKAWVEGKEAAKKACVNKEEQNYLVLFSKDDFGPKLDDVEDLLPKKDSKAAEYKKAWTTASELCKKLKNKVDEAAIMEMNIATQKCLLVALGKIRETLDSSDLKPK